MGKYLFTNSLGSFVFDEKLKLVDKGEEKKLSKKYKDAIKTDDPKIVNGILRLFKEQAKKFYEPNLKFTKQKVKDSVNSDNLVVQTIDNIEEIDKAANLLVKRLREWYELYNPEFSKGIASHDKFVELILEKVSKKKNSMGAELSKEDLKPIMSLAKKINELYKFREEQKKYLEKIMKNNYKNLTAVAGVLIGAKLLAHAGSLKKLVLFPASTIQLLGAEKALFRHIKTNARCPRHGLIVNHSLLANAKQKDHGKIARHLASAIS